MAVEDYVYFYGFYNAPCWAGLHFWKGEDTKQRDSAVVVGSLVYVILPSTSQVPAQYVQQMLQRCSRRNTNIATGDPICVQVPNRRVLVYLTRV